MSDQEQPGEEQESGFAWGGDAPGESGTGVEVFAAELGGPRFGPAPPSGTGTGTGTGGGGMAVAWADLVDFAWGLEATYGTGLRACWPLHADVIQELVALLLARDDAEERAGRALADWHSLLAAAAQRIVVALSACTVTHHEPPAHRQLGQVLSAGTGPPPAAVDIGWRAWGSTP